MCESCVYYKYDDEEEYYFCECELDQDEYYKFLTGSDFDCPYFRLDDEYAVVRHQI
ncbi:MAG: DUF6472 family protein [Lachnospiraceae bacterium]|nr:DUF6472 family protein [Lachnospiraceae bacterium]